MKITSKTINYTVETVEELSTIVGQENDVIVVTDENRGGTFVYRSAEAGTNNGGTIFNGWCRQYSGAVYARWFGFSTDNADNATIIQAIRDYIATSEEELVFTEGKYSYSVSPNWAIDGLKVRAEGTVTFENTGTGDCLIFDDPTGTTFDINWCFTNPILIEGDENTRYGVYVRSCHHSKIGANLRGCGSNSLRIEFSVLNEYNFTTSINEGPFTSATAPAGISISERNPGEEASANIFYNPIIEGVRSVGIFVDKALNNKFIGGTSEGNAGANVECSIDSKNNSFEGIDLEASGISQGFIDRGRFNNWIRIFNDSNSTITSTAVGTKLTGGIHDVIVNQGEKSVLKDFSYGANGGEIIDTGNLTTIENAYDLESATYKTRDKKKGKTTFTNTITVGAFGVTPVVPGNITKLGISLANVNVGDNIHISSMTTIPSSFTAPTAICTASGTISITFSQLNGAAVSPLPSGGNFVVSIN